MATVHINPIKLEGVNIYLVSIFGDDDKLYGKSGDYETPEEALERGIFRPLIPEVRERTLAELRNGNPVTLDLTECLVPIK